jgi:hypothetical protein
MENALTNLLSSKQQIEFLKKERNSLIAVYQVKYDLEFNKVEKIIVYKSIFFFFFSLE